jgi:hypothetical protein
MATTGIARVTGLAFSVRTRVRPSIPGRTRSTRITSGFSWLIAENARSAASASLTLSPAALSTKVASLRCVGLSSITRILIISFQRLQRMDRCFSTGQMGSSSRIVIVLVLNRFFCFLVTDLVPCKIMRLSPFQFSSGLQTLRAYHSLDVVIPYWASFVRLPKSHAPPHQDPQED